MELTRLMIVFAILLLASLLVHIPILKLYCRIWQIDKRSWRRVSLTYFLVFLANLFLGSMIYAVDRFVPDPNAKIGINILALIPALLIPVFIVYKMLDTTFGRAMLAWLCTWISGIVVAVALVLTMRFFLYESYIISAGSMAPTVYGVHRDVVCSNCGFQCAVSLSHMIHENSPFSLPPVESNCPNCKLPVEVSTMVPPDDGDRILVDKLTDPSRWDPTVFRYPENPRIIYIKRLVGLPGETIEIAEGDIFIDGKRLKKRPGDALDLWLPINDTASVPNKPRVDAPSWQTEEKDSSWKQHPDGSWIGKVKEKQSHKLKFPIPNDRLTYNVSLFNRDEEFHPVGDVKVQCLLSNFRGKGSFGFEWKFGERRITTTIQSNGNVTMADAGQPEKNRIQGTLKLSSDDELQLAFAFRDGQAYLLAADRVVVQMDAETSSPKLKTDENHVAIFANNCSLHLKRIRLYRDIYYLSLDEMEFPSTDAVTFPFTLDEDEYFFLGDNSRSSKDARFFGAVKSEALIGVAKWRYWPPSRWHEFQ